MANKEMKNGAGSAIWAFSIFAVLVAVVVALAMGRAFEFELSAGALRVRTEAIAP